MKTFKHGYKISQLLFLLLLLIPIIVSSQDKFSHRKKDFYTSVASEKLYYKGLDLGARQYTFKQDSLLKYYNWLLEAYKGQKPLLNKKKNIIWLYEIGYVQASLHKKSLAIKTFESALKFTDKIKNPRAYKYLNLELADAYRMVGKKIKSNKVFLDLLDMPLIQQDTVKKIYCLRLMAENYELIKDYQKAMELSLQLYNYALKKKDYNTASYKLIQIGRISAFIEHDTTYFEYFHLANTMAQKSGSNRRIGNNLANTGMAYRKAGYPLKSLKYLLDGEKYAKDYTTYDYVYNLNGISATYYDLDSIPQAFFYAKKSYKLGRSINAYFLMLDSSMDLANCYVKMNENDSAKVYIKEALRIGKIINNNNKSINLYKQLSDISFKLKDYVSAVAYLDTSYTLYSKLITDTSNDKLTHLRVESDYYVNRARITQLMSKNKIEKEKRKQLFTLNIGIVIALMVVGISFIIVRKRLRLLKESHLNLVKKNIELDRLNHKLYECEITPKRKIKLEHIKDESLIINKLMRLLHKDEIFKNPDLSLISLSEILNTNTSYLSAIINNHFHCNLRSLLNKYRIDKARKMLISKQFKHYSMEGISIEVGFKSRSVFYQTFKSITGLTPTLYIKNYKPASQDLERMKDSKIEQAI